MQRMRSRNCARATIGSGCRRTAEKRVLNSRRRLIRTKLRRRHVTGLNRHFDRG